jgi:DNA helicase-2/ATP-dependent DNA helicase PcrA
MLRMVGIRLPRYKFKWSNLPSSLLGDLNDELLQDGDRHDPAAGLAQVYGVRPTVDFVRDAWPVLRESWLGIATEPRERVIRALQRARAENGLIRGKRAQMSYLRDLKNAKTLRAIVWRQLLTAGETQQVNAEKAYVESGQSQRSAQTHDRYPTTGRTGAQPDGQHGAQRSSPRSGAATDARTILLNGLTSEGRRIVESPKRRLLVVAGAGAGKTEAMARRIAWWHAVDGVPKDGIVAFTFTERAAEEMKFRVRRYMGLISPGGTDPSLGGMYVGTIHSYCMNTLRRLWPREFHNDEILDDAARYALVQQGYDFVLGLPALAKALSAGKPFTRSRGRTIEYFLRAYDLLNEYNHLDVRLPDAPRPAFGQESEWCKQAELDTAVGDDDVARAFSRSAARYYAYMHCRHFLDFSTSQSELVRRLQRNPKLTAELRSSTTHLVVDEVQDVNVVQDALRKLLVGPAGHLTAVGDHRQAIYSFRGGRIDLMADLAGELTDDPDGEVLELTANFRSTPRIVNLSNEWNDTIPAPATMTSPAMTPGRLWRKDIDPSHVMTARFPDRAEEAKWIANIINELVRKDQGAFHDDKDGKPRGITYSDIAVLVRSSTDARTYQNTLRDADIPAVVRAGPDLFAQPEVLLFASALSLSVQRPEFMGLATDPRSMPGRIHHELHVEPKAAAAITAAYQRLADEGLSVSADAPERLIRAAEAVGAKLYDHHVAPAVLAAITTPSLKKLLRAPGEVRRVFPQRILQDLMTEGGVSQWDTDSPRGRMAMFHLGQLSSVVTGIETPGWTSPSSFRHQVTSLVLWASKEASPDEAPLLVAPDAVTVSTIHSCKGLEFAAVFVADVVSSRFPNSRAKTGPELPFSDELKRKLQTRLLADNDARDGERRLMYVALTRAERYLYVTSSKPSVFFTEIEKLVSVVGGEDTDSGWLPKIELLPAHASHEARLITSFSDLRYYLECPHDFYLRKVLGFTPSIDQAFGYGRGVHNLMREVHLSPAEWAALATDRTALEQKLQGLVGQGMFYLRHTTGEPARLMREKGIQVVADYVTTYSQELSDLTFEPEREFEVLLPDQNILVTGAIDVVRRDDPPRVTIIDFKSGDADSDNRSALDDDEMRMQVSIYAVAAKQELEYEPDQGLVRYLGEKDKAKRELAVPLNAEVVESSRQQVAELGREITARQFHSRPKKRNGSEPKKRCERCDFESLCSLSLASVR